MALLLWHIMKCNINVVCKSWVTNLEIRRSHRFTPLAVHRKYAAYG
jgi:hypothetical protein